MTRPRIDPEEEANFEAPLRQDLLELDEIEATGTVRRRESHPDRAEICIKCGGFKLKCQRYGHIGGGNR
jgi:hypothetical protein